MAEVIKRRERNVKGKKRESQRSFLAFEEEK